jgi:hypothetical protein
MSLYKNKSVAISLLYRDKLLLAILLLGILIRVAFLMVGAKAYYGPELEFSNGDSSSYMTSFQNLWQYGTYSHDLLEPDAAFGRLPGYPFFYGIHYLIFGPAHAIQAVACTQTLLDCISILLVFLITYQLSPKENRLAPYVAAAIYALYPFIIVWTTIIGTELLATFLTLLWLYTLLCTNRGWLTYVLVGIEISMLFYVREFMGILLPITCLYLLFSEGKAIGQALRTCLLVCFGFGMLYIWWPARNYAFQHRIVLVKPERAGYINYKDDMMGFLNWVHSWSNESTYWLQQALNNPEPPFPKEIFASAQEQQQALALVKQANECGSSFYVYKHGTRPPAPLVEPNSSQPAADCNQQVKEGFDKLSHSFKARQPVAYYTRVPLQNVYKVFFKSGTQDSAGVSKKQLLISLLFGYRTLLLVLGLVGLLIYRKNSGLYPIAMYWVFAMFFLCGYFRQLEMRYLLQADVLLLLPASLLIGAWVTKLVAHKNPAQRSANVVG